MPQENSPEQTDSHDEPETVVRYFIATGDGEVYENKQNLPLESLKKMKTFQGASGLFRFAYDPRNNTFYAQDEAWRKLVSSGDKHAWDLLNRAAKHVSEEFGARNPKSRWGDPPNSAVARRISQYGVAWNYIKNYIHKEFGTDPVDVMVVEFAPDMASKEERAVWFSQSGGKVGDISTNEPTIFVNRKKYMLDDGDIDFGVINQILMVSYLKHVKEIADTSPDQDKYEKVLGQWQSRLSGTGGYELYFAIWNNGQTQIHRTNDLQRQRLLDENSLRKEPSMKGYPRTSPVIMFSFLPGQNQIIFQNQHPRDMERYPLYKQMLDDIKRTMSSIKQVPKDDLLTTYDPSANSPFVSKMSDYKIVWDYVTDVLAPKYHFSPTDISVIEMPLSDEGDKIAAFVRSPQEEMQESPKAQQYKISHGISVPYPFILLENRIANLGLKYHALLHEYQHFVQAIQNVEFVPYSYDMSQSPSSSEEKQKRFIEYINNPLEQDAHLKQMIYMLEMGMAPKSVLDFFMPGQDMIARAEYGKILDKAVEAYDEERHAARTGMEKTAGLELGINDWWHFGLQEQLNQSQHVNDITGPYRPSAKPYNLKKKRQEPQIAKGPRTLEGLLATKHDTELNSMKSMEQLLREGQI